MGNKKPSNRKKYTSFFNKEANQTNEMVKKTLAHKQEEINTLRNTIRELKVENIEHTDTIKGLNSEINQLTSRVAELANQNNRHKDTIDSLSGEITKLKGVIANLKKEIKSFSVDAKLKAAPVASKKVKNDLNKSNSPASKTPKPVIKSNKKLAVITTFFNPANYINLRYNYLKFSEEVKKHADLFPIELSFNGEFFIKDSNVIKINGSSENVLWQKERLLQIALDNLPLEYENVAWLDCDILFENPNWAQEINDKLEEYKVVQVYERAKRLDADGNIGLTSTGIIKKNEEDRKVHNEIRGTTGFGWAIRRDVIDEIKFIDTQIIGGADVIMYFAFHNINGTRIHRHMTPEWQEAIKPWCDMAYNAVKGSVGYVSGDIIHLYHGKPAKRGYGDRHDPLRKYNFDPRKHLELTDEGIWRFTLPQLNTELKKYFVSRDEDDNVLRVNSYFDNVYVLNLDRRPDRLKTVKKELDSFGIKFERFSAVDGNNISDEEYDFNKFVVGRGMIENKYALACLRSHIEIIKDARRNGYKRILIFEDDVILDPDFMVRLQNIKSIPNWKLLYFGASQYNWDVEFLDNFYYSKQSLGMFAVAVDSSIYNQILEGNEEDLSVDNLLSKIQKENYKSCYTYYPNICVPDVSDSDIRGSRDQAVHNKRMRWNHFQNKNSSFCFSTIMTSYLGDYPGSRTNPIEKFHRAINSWLNQDYQNKELIIVSDGCPITEAEVGKWNHIEQIKLVRANKSEATWPGSRRQMGVDAAAGDWITYLDTDDMYAPNYLAEVANVITKHRDKQFILNRCLTQKIENEHSGQSVNVILKPVSITNGLSKFVLNGETHYYASRDSTTNSYSSAQIIHQKNIPYKWQDSDRRGEDVDFANKFKAEAIKISQPGYIICHMGHGASLDL